MIKERKNSAKESPEILIAEDSPTQATQLKHLLETHHYKVSVTRDGKQAMDWLTKHKPALVISDIMMPEINGYELCKKIKSNKNTKDIPVILLTILADPEEIIEGLSCGADSFITKPYNEKYLLSHVERILSKENVVYHEKVPFSAQIIFKGKKRFIQAEQQNVIKLMLDIYEGAIQQNEKLIQTQEELRLLNERLESLVEDRTSDLTQEIKLSNQITKRLKESEEKWRTLVTTIPDYIGLVDCEGKFLFLNHYANGFSEKNTIGISHLEFIPNEWKEFYRQKFEECISTQKNQIFEYTAFGDSNKLRTYETCLVPVIQQGKVLNVMAIARDITERRQAEKKLRNSEERLKILFEYAPDAYYLSDLKGNFIEGNLVAEKLMGYNRNELIGKSFLKLKLLSLKQFPRAAKLLVKNSLGQATGPDEFVLSRKDGSKVTVEILTHPIKIKDQTLVLGLARDISDRKLAEEKIIIERRMLRTLIDNLPNQIYVKDFDCRKVIANKADVSNIGLKEEAEVLGKTDIELFPGQPGQRGYADDKKVISSGKAIIEREEDFVDKKGVRRWLLTTKVPLHDKDGKITGLVGIGHDITERKEHEEELTRAKEKAEESERLKSAFLTNMSHEIRTPMNGILGFAELLKEPQLTSEEQQDFIKIIGISGARMLSTINNIVDMSRIESGMIKIDIKETNINEKIEFTYKFFKPEVENKGLQFLFKTSLPSKVAIIKTDNEKVYAVLTNLVKNAIKFTYKGSIEFGYDMVKTQHAESMQFFVKDTGVGIPQNQKELIFERFRQGSESINRKYEGSGLGLSICKSYVEMLGGKIWVESEEGKGSIFYFTIPYNAVSEQTNEIENVVFTENKEVQIKKLKILIVEDDEISYSLLTRVIQKISKEVLHAITGVQAIEACRNNPDFDLVLMDIRMPRMNGLEATQQIRKFNKDVIIIAQTAYGFSGDFEKALEAGCNDYITKPINKTLLFELIKKHCNK